MGREKDAVVELMQWKRDTRTWLLIALLFMVLLDGAVLAIYGYAEDGALRLDLTAFTIASLVGVFIVWRRGREQTVLFGTLGIIAYWLSLIYIALIEPVLVVIAAIVKVMITIGLIRCIRAVVLAERRVAAGAKSQEGSASLPEARVRRR